MTKNRNRFRICLPLLLILIFLIPSCEETGDEVSPEDSLAAIAKVDEGMVALAGMLDGLEDELEETDSMEQALDIMDVTDIYTLFRDAQDLNPYNNDANFGAGMTGFLMVLQNDAVRDQLLAWDEYLIQNDPFRIGGGYLPKRFPGIAPGMPALPLLNDAMRFLPNSESLLSRATDGDVPLFSEMQDLIETFFLPTVNEALTSLAAVETEPDFTFTIGFGVQEDALETEFDITDVHVLEALLYGVKAVLKTSLAYNFDFTSFDSTGIMTHLSPGSDFATLKAQGSINLSDAHAALQQGINHFESALLALQAESDTQDNDFMVMDAEDIADAEDALADAQDALEGPIWIQLDVEDGAPFDSIQVNVRQFFMDPIEDFKALAPPYTMSTERDTVYDGVYDFYYLQYEQDTVQVDEFDFNNTAVSLQFIFYHDSETTDLIATMSVNWIPFQLTDGEGSLDSTMVPLPIWQAYQEFQSLVEAYNAAEVFPYVDIFFYWSGTVTNGESLSIQVQANVNYEFLEGIYIMPYPTWTATTYEDWMASWPDPTFNGILPGFTHADLETLLDIDAEDWEDEF